MKPKNLFVAVVAGVALSVGIFMAARLQVPAEPRTAFVLPQAEQLPEFSLLDQHSAAFTAASLRGQWDLVFFGFTFCPDICPATLQKLAGVNRELEARGVTPPRIILVSVDPERDTPELLGRYVDYFRAGIVGVTGELEDIRALTKALYIYFEKVPLDGDNYTVDHSPAVLVINPEGQYHAGFSGGQSADDLVHDLPIIMEQY